MTRVSSAPAAVVAAAAAVVVAVLPSAATCRLRLAVMRRLQRVGVRAPVRLAQAAAGAGAGGGRQGGGAAGGGARGGGAGGGQEAANDDRPAFVDYPEEFTQASRQRIGGDDGARSRSSSTGRHGDRDRQRGAGGACRSFKLPLSNHLVLPDGTTVPGTDYYVPGSVLPRRGGSEEPARARLRAGSRTSSSTTARSGRWTAPSAHPASNYASVAWFASPNPAAQRLGLGPEVSRQGHRDRRSQRRPGPRVRVRQRLAVPRAAARHLQVPLQRDVPVRCADDEGGRSID